MDFSKVEAEFQKLKRQFETGALTEAEFKAQLEKLMLQDEQGHWWTIGYETGQWYYHDGEKWVHSEPPKLAETAPPTPMVGPQSAPKALIRGEGFLLHCLPTLVAGPVSWVLTLTLSAGGEPFPGLLEGLIAGTVGAFVLWLLLRGRVTTRWLMILLLTAAWNLAFLAGASANPSVDLELEAEVLIGVWMLVSMVFVLALGISVLFSRLFEGTPASKQ